MKPRERVMLAVAALLSAVALVAVFWRLRRGIDFTDEAFYLALPYRFALGDQPFVDELNIAQTSGLLLYPFVKLHVAVRGSTGIFLFIRILYVLFFSLVGWTAYQLGSTRLPRHAALLAGTACIAFLPYGIPGLSYNTLGCGLLAIGLFVTTRSLVAPPEEAPKLLRDPLTWGGFALGAATFAYPTLVVGAAVSTAAVFALANGRRVSAAVRVAIGGGLFVAIVSPLFLWAGVRNMREMLAYSGAGAVASSTGKLTVLWNQFVAQHPELPMMMVALSVAASLSRRWPRLVALFLPFLPLLARGALVGSTATSLGYVASFALTAPLLAVALKEFRVGLTLVVGVWLPSVLCGAASAYTSSNGAVAAGLGLYPAAIVSGILLAMWIVELVRPLQSAELRGVFGFAPATLLYVLVKIVLQNDAVYRDGHVATLTTMVTEGPYKGLYTTPERQRSLAKTSADIVAHAKSQRALFYYDFPAGYLIAGQRPLVSSAWTFPMEPRMSIDAQMFSARARPGDFVFKLGALSPWNNPLDRAVKDRCGDPVPGSGREGYSVYQVR